MKKYLFIIGFAGMALFTACSTADDLVSEKPIETPPVEEPKETTLLVEARQNSEIPITLGVGQSRGITRSPMNPDGEGNFTTEDGKYLGVFCLATGTQANESNIPTMIKNFKWNTAPADDEDGLIVRMRNVPAQVTTDGSTSNVVFLDSTTLVNPTPTQQEWYYPMGNWLKYNFYAYYPRQAYEVDGKKTLSFSENQVLETYLTIDGSQDVIWGRAHPWNPGTPAEATGFDPYCAKYFRKKRAEVGDENIKNYYPKFVFEHKLAQFRFFVKAASPEVLSNLTSLDMKVTDMYIANAIYSLSLVVAQKDSTKNGTLKMKSVTPSTKKLRIKTNTDADRFDQEAPFEGEDVSYLDHSMPIELAAVDVTAVDGDGNPLDDGYVGYIMLPDPRINNDSFKYQLTLKVNYTVNAVEKTEIIAIDMDPPLIPGSDPEEFGFEAGKIYNIIVNVQSPEKISAKAVLQGWQTYEDDEHNPYIEYNN